MARHPEIGELVEALRDAGASHAAMSGSGSAVFGLFDDRESAEAAAGRLKDATRRAFVTRTLTRAEYRRLARPSKGDADTLRPVHRGSLSVDKHATCRRNSPSYTLTVCATWFGPLLRSASSSSDRCDVRRVRGATVDSVSGAGNDGAWPSGKARDFGSRIRRFESFRPSQFARLVR